MGEPHRGRCCELNDATDPNTSLGRNPLETGHSSPSLGQVDIDAAPPPVPLPMEGKDGGRSSRPLRGTAAWGDHRNTAWFGMEGTLEDHPVPALPCAGTSFTSPGC